MLIPIYTNALIFGPAFVIVLALCVALLVRFPSLKSWIGAAMVIIGLIELSLVPLWVFWIFLVGLITIIIGTIMFANALLNKREILGIAFLTEKEGAGIGLIAIVVGVLGILLFARDIWGFAFGLVTLAFGTAGAANLLPENRRAKIGFASTVVGVIVILIAVFTNFKILALAFFVGLVVVFTGVSVGVSGLPYWIGKHSSGNTVRRLKKSIYALLAIVIFSSALVLSLRTTHALREEILDDWSRKTAADTTVRGVVTEIHLNHEVNNYGYSYHIFPALIIVNVTEVLKAGEMWSNQTEASEYWVNQNMSIGYDKPDVLGLATGQRVEASGYFDVPIEDTWSYSYKLVIATEIDGSYIKPLQGD